MRSNLFFIPHEIFGIPLFGRGWALGLLVLVAALWLIAQLRARRTSSEIISGGWIWLLAIPLITIVLPAIEAKWPDGTPIGLPIRGYGTMMLLGLLSGIALTAYRARRFGISLDAIISLAMWTMLSGIVGARLFYVIQKWDQFPGEGMARWIEVLKLTEGGLVVYGGMIGGTIGGAIFCYRHRLNVFALADLLVPAFLVGLAFGRIGCLLNGCCFGGVCTSDQLPSIRFPHGSAPYVSQIETGQLLGIEAASTRFPRSVQSVLPGSPAEEVGIQAGDELKSILAHPIEPAVGSDPTSPPSFVAVVELAGRTRHISPDALPKHSLPVHPTQIYASINALLLCVLTWLLQPLVRRDGLVFVSGVILYAISRFLIEWIRNDERGQFGTQFTISQWVALTTGALALAGFVWLIRQPARRVWDWSS